MEDHSGDGREPAFNAPWPSVALVLTLLGAYCLQRLMGADAVAQTYGFVPTDLMDGRLYTLATALLLHGGWLHVGMNAIWALALAPPVSRFFGTSAVGAVGLWLFFVVCGVVGCLGFAIGHWGASDVILVGASGGVAGLMGAASRLMGRRWGLAPLNDRRVLSMGLSWLIINLALALLGGTALLEGAVIGWEAHLAGYAAGLLLAGPALWLVAGADRLLARLCP